MRALVPARAPDGRRGFLFRLFKDGRLFSFTVKKFVFAENFRSMATPRNYIKSAAKEKKIFRAAEKAKEEVMNLPNGVVSAPHLFLFLNGDKEKQQ